MSNDVKAEHLKTLEDVNSRLGELNKKLKMIVMNKTSYTDLKIAVNKARESDLKIGTAIKMTKTPEYDHKEFDECITYIKQKNDEVAQLVSNIEKSYEFKHKLYFDQLCYIPKDETEQAGLLAGFDAERFISDDMPISIESLHENYKAFNDEHKRESDYSLFDGEIYTRLASRENKQYRKRKMKPTFSMGYNKPLDTPSYKDDD